MIDKSVKRPGRNSTVTNGDRARIGREWFYNSHGGTLLYLIVAMVVFSALAAALVPLFSASTLHWLDANQDTRAYFLAESGYRYAAGEYRHSTVKNQTLENLHDAPAYVLLNNQGQFDIKVYPYFLATTASHDQGTASLSTKFPGGKPSDSIDPDYAIPDEGNLLVGGNSYNYTDYDDGTGVFTLASGILNDEGLEADADVFLAGLTARATPGTEEVVIGRGGDLYMEDASFFPPKNGVIKILGEYYTYKTRNLTTTPHRLEFIRSGRELDGDFSLTAHGEGESPRKVILIPFIQVQSEGTFDQTSRKITYYIPLPDSSAGGSSDGEGGNEVVDNFDGPDLSPEWSNVFPEAVFAIENQALVLKEPAVLDPYGYGMTMLYRESLLVFDDPGLESEWEDSGRLLDYNVQVKIKAGASVEKYSAGLAFRVGYNDSGDLNNYGISFTRARDNSGYPDEDGIPREMVDLKYGYDLSPPLLELWQRRKTGSLLSFYYLAYVELPTSFKPDWTTLLVRINEGPSITCSSGAADINAGDHIQGASSGAEADVVRAYRGSDYVLQLNNASGSFSAGETLRVDGSAAGTVITYRSRDNFIKAFYREADSGNLPGTINWAPDEITSVSGAANNDFTLAQWQFTNSTSGLGDFEVLDDRLASGTYLDNTTIRSTNFNTPDEGSWPENRYEVGLVTFGHLGPDAADSVSFDDFALQYGEPSNPGGFVPPIQE